MKSYRTYSSILSANHPQNPHGFSALTHRAKNLYNVASFYINAYSASPSNQMRIAFHMRYRFWKNSMVSLMN